MKLKKQKAVCVGAFLNLWREGEGADGSNGLKDNCKACAGGPARAIMPLPCSITGCRRSGLKLERRTIAAPLRGVFLLAVVPTHGVIASAFCMGAPRGNPSGLLFPFEQSANPRGVARPRSGGVDGSQNLSKGA